MKEKQVLRTLFTLSVIFITAFLLSACQEDQVSIALIPGRSRPITPTPFQAHSPTPRPTMTFTSTPEPTATRPTCISSQGTIEQFEVQFQAQPMVFRVYLPPCYAERQDIRYPVLYLIHGQTYSDDQWDRLGADETADQLILDALASPFIIVMPLEANTFEDIFISPFPTDLIDGLIPWIDANFSTCAERACRAIGGLSRGGAWALRLGFLHWELFGSVGLHSTPPFIGDTDRFPTWLSKIPPDQLPRLYLDTGRRDWFIGTTTQFEQQLTLLGVPHEWYLFNGTHDEEYWSNHVADYLTWYTRPWESPDEE